VGGVFVYYNPINEGLDNVLHCSEITGIELGFFGLHEFDDPISVYLARDVPPHHDQLLLNFPGLRLGRVELLFQCIRDKTLSHGVDHIFNSPLSLPALPFQSFDLLVKTLLPSLQSLL